MIGKMESGDNYCFPFCPILVGLKTLLQKCLSKPKFYGDLVYKFRGIIGKIYFSVQLAKLIFRYNLKK